MAPHSSTLAWKIPWMEEPGRLQSRGSLRVGHNWVTSLSLFTFMHWRRQWQPTPVFLPGESQGRGSRWATVYGVAQSRTRLKRLSSSSSSSKLEYITVTSTFCIMTLCIKLFTFFPCHTCYNNCNPIFEPTFSFFLEWLLLYFLVNSYFYFNF